MVRLTLPGESQFVVSQVNFAFLTAHCLYFCTNGFIYTRINCVHMYTLFAHTQTVYTRTNCLHTHKLLIRVHTVYTFTLCTHVQTVEDLNPGDCLGPAGCATQILQEVDENNEYLKRYLPFMSGESKQTQCLYLGVGEVVSENPRVVLEKETDSPKMNVWMVGAV